MAVSLATKTALTALQMVANRGPDGEKHSSFLSISIGIVLGIVLFFSMVVYVLTSPLAFDGALGQFQQEYAYLLGSQNSAFVPEGGLTEEDISQMVSDIEDPDRQAVVETALSLVGRVKYFWGGKPTGPGPDERWGAPTLVTAPGVSSSGTILPFGYDCTGYVYWVYWTALGMDSLPPQASNSIWYGTHPIDADELEPGDIVYKQRPSDSGINHVGIYYGKDEDGNNLFIHCSSGGGGVVLNGYSGFQYFRRPPILEGGD